MKILKRKLSSLSLKNENETFSYYRALPRGNTSSGNTKRSCGWS